VLTHHNDNLRTGWNSHETTLTPTNVPSLQLIATVSLDEQVDAQPLFVPGLSIAGGTHDVVYVATENDTVYAIDAASGAILLSKTFGPPVPISAIPFQCPNNSGNVGITSTPVIDPASSTMYVMVYSYENGAPIYRLHALDLSTLQDKIPPAVVNAKIKLSGGGFYQFDPSVSRQRSALLEANGNIYAAFASFCDFKANSSRGWVLGWQAGSLSPLQGVQLNDRVATSTDTFFLSSVWMSGNGVAADSSGNLYFSTGNSDQGSYSSSLNLSESIIKLSPALQILDFFTPSNMDVRTGCVFDSNPGVQCLDGNDGDVSAGGVLLLPDQAGFPAGLAIAAGKFGPMYLLNRSKLGGFSKSGNDQVLGTFDIGLCWCGESYFTGPDGNGRVVSSGGDNIIVWRIQTSSNPTLVAESPSLPALTTGQDPGFFTSVSSNGTQNPIIWAVGRPVDVTPANVTLYAFDPVAKSLLFSSKPGDAGTWANILGNANIVPVAANGHVYVASGAVKALPGVYFPFGRLSIFGLPGSAGAQPQIAQTAPQTAAQSVQTAAVEATQLSANEHQIYGTITTVNGDLLTIKTRTGALVNVDATQAVQEYASVLLLVGEPVRILGSYNTSNVLQATSVARAKPSPALWPPDR
jgi:hypothetical protein